MTEFSRNRRLLAALRMSLTSVGASPSKKRGFSSRTVETTAEEIMVFVPLRNPWADACARSWQKVHTHPKKILRPGRQVNYQIPAVADAYRPTTSCSDDARLGSLFCTCS